MKILEYIQSTGTQYIITDIIPDATHTLEIQFQYMNNTSADDRVFAIQESNPYLLFGRYQNKFRLVYGNIVQVSSMNQDTNMHTLYCNNSFRLDDTIYVSSFSQTNTQPVVLFSNRGNYSANGLRIYKCKYYDTSNNLVRNLVPVKDDNDVVCLYDKVSQSYFYNSGTGTFIAGPEIKELLVNIDSILYEKETKIVPENIKNGVTVFGVTGNYEGSGGNPDIKLFDSIANMQADPTAQLNDLATVYADSSAPITATTEFSKCICPNIVALPEAFSDYANISFRSTGSGWFDCWGQLDSSSFMLDGYGEQGQVRIQYTSQDGVTYTRTDGGSEEVDFGTTIRFGYPEEWNDAIGYFIQVGSTNFEGLFQYTTNNLYEIASTQLTAIANNVVSASFLGQNGVEIGNLQNSNITSLDELKEKVQVYSNLSYLELSSNLVNNFNLYGIKSSLMPNLNTSGVTNMYQAFVDCKLTTVPNFDTSNVTNMANMFYQSDNIISVPNWNTSNVTNTAGMFYYCHNLTNISNFDTSNVVDMQRMFLRCSRISNIPNFNTSNVTYMGSMFFSCYNLTTIPNFDTSNVTDMSSLFWDCNNLTDYPNLNMSKVTSTHNMFYNCSNLTNIPNLNMSNVMNMGNMFRNCNNLSSESLSNIANSLPNAENIANSSPIFLPYIGINVNRFSNSDREVLLNKGYLDADPHTSDWGAHYNINGILYDRGEDFDRYGVRLPNYIKQQLNISTSQKITISSDGEDPGIIFNMQSLMYSNFAFNNSVEILLNTSNVINMSAMFYNCANLKAVSISDTQNVSNSSRMFTDCKSLQTVPNLNMSKVKYADYMFTNCYNLASIPSMNTQNIKSAYWMFYNCYNLTVVPNLDLSNLASAVRMFMFDNHLVTIGALNICNVTSMDYMFSYCSNLVNAPTMNTESATSMASMFDGCSNLVNIPQYDTANVTNIRVAFWGCRKLSDASIQNIINMCLNSNITNTAQMNLFASGAGPLDGTGISNTRFQNRWAELTAAGWTY